MNGAAVFFAVWATAFVAAAMGISNDAGAYAMLAALLAIAAGYVLAKAER